MRSVLLLALLGCHREAAAPVAPVTPPCERPFAIEFPAGVTPTEGAENGKKILSGGANKVFEIVFSWDGPPQTVASLDGALAEITTAGKYDPPTFADRRVEGAELARWAPLTLAGGSTAAIAIAYRKPSLVIVLIAADPTAPAPAAEYERILASLRFTPDCAHP